MWRRYFIFKNSIFGICLFTINSCGFLSKDIINSRGVSEDQIIYEKSIKEFRYKKFETALQGFRKIIETYPRSPYVDDAQYRIAYVFICHDNSDWHYTNARNEFQNLLHQYENSRYTYESQNWISVLNKLLEHYEYRKALAADKRSNEETINQLEKDNKTLHSRLQKLTTENESLKNNILQLEEILEELKRQEQNPNNN